MVVALHLTGPQKPGDGLRLMRVAGFLEDPAKVAALLKTLGWHTYATDSQGARAPLPTADHEAPVFYAE